MKKCKIIPYVLSFVFIWGIASSLLYVTTKIGSEASEIESVYYACNDFVLMSSDFCVKDKKIDDLVKHYIDEISKTEHSFCIKKLSDEERDEDGFINKDDRKVVLCKAGEEINRKYAFALIRYIVSRKLGLKENSTQFKRIWERHKRNMLHLNIETYAVEPSGEEYEYSGRLLEYIAFKSGYFYDTEWEFSLRD